MSQSISKIASQKRYLYLLEKIQSGKVLTSKELAELEKYEEISKEQSERKKRGKTLSSKGAADLGGLCELAALPAAAGGEAIAALAGRLEIEEKALERMAARDGKRLEKLCRLAGLADSPLPQQQAADRLGMSAAAFAEFLKTDPQAGAIWRHTRTDAQLRAYRDLQRQAADSPAAAKQLLEQFARVIAAGGADLGSIPLRRFAEMIGEKYDRVNYWKNAKCMPWREDRDGAERRIVVDLDTAVPWWGRQLLEENKLDLAALSVIRAAELLGISNAMMHEYFKQGMPRNRDKEQTVNYFAARDWYKELLCKREAPAAAPVNPLADAKALLKKLEYEKAVAAVVDRVAVELGLAARAGREIQVLEQKFRELPGALAGHSAEEIKEALDALLREFRQLASQIPEDILDVLPPHRGEKLAEFLNEIAKEGNGDDRDA